MVSKDRVLFVGAGPSQAPAIEHAKTLGYEVYAIDSNPNAEGFQHVAGSDVGDIRDPEFIRNCAQRYDVSGIVAVSTDAPVPAIARASDSLGLPSISISAADISVNKLLQRNYFKAAGLRIPKYMSFRNVEEAINSAYDVGFPMVVKPTDSSGSRGVSLVSSEKELKKAAEEALSVSRSKVGILEEYVDGTEVSVEGFVLDGVFHELCMSEKTRTLPPYLLDTEVCFPDSIVTEEHETIIAIAKKAILACGLNNCPVHMELLRSENGPVVVELAARGAGFRVFTNIIPYVTGVDTIDIQLKLALGKKVEMLMKKPLRGAVISFLSPIPGKLKCVKGIDLAKDVPGVQEAQVYIEAGTLMGELKSGSDRIGHVIVFGDSRIEAKMRAKIALSLIKFELE